MVLYTSHSSRGEMSLHGKEAMEISPGKGMSVEAGVERVKEENDS